MVLNDFKAASWQRQQVLDCNVMILPLK